MAVLTALDHTFRVGKKRGKATTSITQTHVTQHNAIPGLKQYISLPIEHISSFAVSFSYNITFLLFGLGLIIGGVVLGLYLAEEQHEEEFGAVVAAFGGILGLINVVMFFLARARILEVASATRKIIVDMRGLKVEKLKEFISVLEKQQARYFAGKMPLDNKLDDEEKGEYLPKEFWADFDSSPYTSTRGELREMVNDSALAGRIREVGHDKIKMALYGLGCLVGAIMALNASPIIRVFGIIILGFSVFKLTMTIRRM